MDVRHAGPVPALLDLLLDPDTAMPFLRDPDDPRTVAIRPRLHGLPAVDRMELYKRLSQQAWNNGRHSDALRLLIAESRIARHLGDEERLHEVVLFLAERHRLRGGFVVAEMWLHTLRAVPLSEQTAALHASALRELASIAEVAGDYGRAIGLCHKAVAICERYADQPGIAERNVKVLLQMATIERTSGRLLAAVSAVDAAREKASADSVGPFVQGLVWLRQGGNDLILGRFEESYAALERAATCFDGISDHNVQLTKTRQVACLRALGRLDDALALSDELIGSLEFADDNGYRFGQVMLERAEVLQEQGDTAAVIETLDRIRHLYEGSEQVEALRWRRHMARSLIELDGDLATAAVHLGVVLDVAGRDGRRDISRTMLALHDLIRIRDKGGISDRLWFAAGRAALVAADLQRDSLLLPEMRWSLHAQREEVYAAAILIHTELGLDDEAAQIAETGRSDVLNQLLALAPDDRTGAVAGERLVTPSSDPERMADVFGVARSAVEAIRTGGERSPAAILPLPGEMPSAIELDAMADLIVVVNIGTDSRGWWSATMTRPRGGSWSVSHLNVPPDLEPTLTRLAGGIPLPSRGTTRARWEALSAFLLHDPIIWAGSPERPQRIVICPDPRLWQVPYAALTHDGARLCDVATVTLTPSLRTLQLLHRRDATDVLPTKGPAVSLLDPSLPGAAQEASALDSWAAGHVPIDRLADMARLADASLLYITGHAEAAGSTAPMGLDEITLDRLAAQRLPRIVVLNGCWSGTAASRYGRDPLSLAVGGLLGGADTVLAGTGLIGSEACARVGAVVLRLLQTGVPAATALRAAQLEVRDENPELGPFEWGGLCVVGRGD
jgi:tetratricopeptide (TPR) repeat protein